MLACALPVTALPIDPPLKDILRNPEQPAFKYPASRAGWNGSEVRVAQAVNPEYERLRYMGSPQAMRAQLLAAAVPDWRAFLALGLLIVFLRYARDRRELAPATPRPRLVLVPRREQYGAEQEAA